MSFVGGESSRYWHAQQPHQQQFTAVATCTRACAPAQRHTKQVTACGSLGEGLSKLGGACSYDVLLADAPTLGSDSSEREQLLAAAKGLPCIFMAAQPTPQDVMAGACGCVVARCVLCARAAGWCAWQRLRLAGRGTQQAAAAAPGTPL